MKQLVYLDSSVRIEPLQWQWYAWSYLIAPITCAKLMTKHISLLESYLSAPELHYSAAKNPNLTGGSFVAVDPLNKQQVSTLLEQHKNDCRPLLELAKAFSDFDSFLQITANGHSLEPLYEEIPSSLQGCVELTYDSNNYPSIRLIESLLYIKYQSYIRKGQSVALSKTQADKRELVFSTPRFEDADTHCLSMSFADKKIDTLSKLRYQSQTFENVVEALELQSSDIDMLQSYLTQAKPRTSTTYNGKDIRMRYFGHACVLLETANVSILIDPLINYAHENGADCFTLNDLPPSIDYVLITHAHQDHVVFETLLQIRHKVKHIVVPQNLKGSFIDPSMRLLLQQLGFESIITLEELEKIALPGGQILSIPFLGEHADLNIQAKSGYAIRLANKQILFCADSNNLDNHIYEYIYDEIGRVDHLFIGMECKGASMSWFFGRLLDRMPEKSACQSRRFDGSDSEKAWRMIKTLHCKSVYVYAMAMEPWLSHIMAINYDATSLPFTESNKLIECCHNNGIEAQRPFLKLEKILK